MEAILLIFLLMGIILVLGILTIGIIIIVRLGNKKKVFATIFLKSGGQSKFSINRLKSQTTTINNCVYTFDEKAVRKTPWKDFIYYKEGINAPLTFNDIVVKSNMSPEELKIILEDDLTRQLFSSEELKALQILLIITMVMVGIVLLIVLFQSFGGVSIKDNEANREFLMNVTRSVIMGY